MPKRDRRFFDSDEEWLGWQEAMEAVRRYSIVRAFGWTPDQIDRQDRDEVSRLLWLDGLRAAVEEQYRRAR